MQLMNMASAIEHKNSSHSSSMFAGASPIIFELAKNLRPKMTDAEKHLWYYLKNGIHGCKFRRQHPLLNYIADFYCHRCQLIIEVDGNIHELVEVKQCDKEREDHLSTNGYKVLRFTNQQVLKNIDSVLAQIISAVEEKLQNLNLLTKAQNSSL